MQDHLLGYLLGALEPSEVESVEKSLHHDAALRGTLERLERHLVPLKADLGHFDPPPGLVERTCAFVASYAEPRPAAPATSGRWSLADVAVAAAVVLVAAAVFFPAVSSSRSQAQIAACQDNFRHLGRSLAQFADYHGGYFPQIPDDPKTGVAGVYAPILVEKGYLSEPERLFCPARLAARPEGFERRIPSLAQVERAVGEELVSLQQQMGGDYGFNLGFVRGGRYQAVRNLGRTGFALLADAPGPHLKNRQSHNHGGRGQNVLFEDLHVEFLTTCRHCESGDDYYLNEDGLPAAGKHVDDAVIGRSSTSPLKFLRLP